VNGGGATTGTTAPTATHGRTITYEPGLDGLRAVSVAGVLFFHACATSGLDGWFRGGNLGVSVFFTLSGFLITTLLLTEHHRDGRVDLGRFWTRRIRRLVPTSLTVVVAVTLLSTTSWFDLRRADAWAALASVTNWHVIAGGEARLLQTIVGPLGPTWSLGVEEQAYLVLGFGAWWATRLARPARAVAIGAGAVVVVSVVVANVVSTWSPRLEFGTDVRAAEIAGGCLLAVALRERRAWIDAHARVLDVAGAAALAAMVVAFLTAGTAPWLLRGGHAALALVWAVAITSVLAHGRVHRSLALVPFVAVGRWSYSLYLVHWPVFLVLSPERTGIDGVALVAVKIAVATAVAVALHLLVEQPLRASTASTRTTVTAWLATSVAAGVLAAVVLA
jgi:peptidoglycan/LPS O-acetylase OafA/YrhL